MGLFSNKKKVADSTPTPPPPLPVPGEVGAERYEAAKHFMSRWTTVVGQASEPEHWAALAEFGRIGDATQAEQNSQSANMRFFNVANSRFNGNFEAFLDWPWKNWLEIAKQANRSGDRELAVRIFFFTYSVQTMVTFGLDESSRVGFQHPTDPTYKAIAAEANAAASSAPDDFAVVERANQPPVPKAAILMGTQQILGS